ncbi:MAG TPA: class I SAM-dependent RNA methyltransferase [Bacillus sp. (in: firmicutes)]|uniref:THUMP domain-containing class I SAM-dependent RNA methyltransferase n=1 Tax=Bacillus litorisediminis TaxID=2922713 RepID=UPI001FAC1EE9|nr:class I SAM-dependent RNA methyltransferase [Bacillus litorisediminis]HWO76347.1 class I SAM-dependent RNA methyltransferase [Bacillus sp. (in: firmicutes)]
MTKYQLIATAAMGLEAIVADEVRKLGLECTVDNGKVLFQGDDLAIARTNLWLRTADRIKIQIGEFKATTFDELFEKTKVLPWEQFITKDSEFPVSGKSVKSTLYSVPDCQAIVKKAIVERLKSQYRGVQWFQETGAKVPIEVAIRKDVVTLTIDTSGAGLHKRGYRIQQGAAPLKETLAAALIQLTNWTPDRPFVDLFCGSGTIPIEAALIGQNIAPGFNRDFLAEEWEMMSEGVWERAREEAEDLANYDQRLDIMGSDIQHTAVEMAKQNAQEAGLAGVIQFKQMQATDFTTTDLYGVIVSNPPYGERISDRPGVERLYQQLGQTLADLDTWSLYFITSHEEFEKHFGKIATKKRKLFNGFIRTDYYQYWGKRPPRN